MTVEEPPQPKQWMTEDEREQHLREWFEWYMENEPEPGPDVPWFRQVETIDPAPYL